MRSPIRLAALYDVHGNLPALEAVLADVRVAGVDEIIVGGDVIPGPMPAETLDRLLDLETPVRFIRGNGERDALSRMRGTPTDAIPQQYLEAMEWVADRMRPYERELSSWPSTLRVSGGQLGGILFCHATPRNDTEIFTRITDESRLRAVFDSCDAELIVCGHTHMQFDRTVGPRRVVNAGSVGMPFGEASACWLLLDSDVTLRRSTYDLESAAQRIRATAYPQREEFAARNVLRPPTEASMIEAFSRAELTA